MRKIVAILIFVGFTVSGWAIPFHGHIIDAETGEEIIGAKIQVKEKPDCHSVSGLDGTFNLNPNSEHYTLCISCMGYKYKEVNVEKTSTQEIKLESNDQILNEVTVVAVNPGKSEAGARLIERNALNVVNVMSAQAMELSPDITVANVIQRMSGVTVERNSSGEGQYAILRGMDKRYNYTLVNGVKIPSPDNKNRFVPLDMFPSEMLDRLEVNKSLTANLEGDGIGGAVNLVMKDAPTERQFTAGLSTGYNAMYLGRDFQSFSRSGINTQSPYEAMGKPENYAVTGDNFTTSNLHVRNRTALPDLSAQLSYGDRFFNNRLGVMVAGSYLHTNRGKESEVEYMPGKTIYGTQNRNYSTAQTRAGGHLKLDYRLAKGQKLTWYNGYMDMQEQEVRTIQDEKTGSIRLKYTNQHIFNSTLGGEHLLADDKLKINWSGVFSRAKSMTPDNTEINMIGEHVANTNSATRRWEHNSDRDWSGYLDLNYKLGVWTLTSGAMYRDKSRTSFFNEYTFDSSTGTAHPQYQGVDWQNYDEIQLTPRKYGNIGDPLNYDATERIGAAYLMGKWSEGKWDLTAGLRMEHTSQGYTLLFPRDEDPEGEQNYVDWLPSVHAKYHLHDNGALHLSYCRSINRPSFFEIVPYSIINDDYKEKGNPQLKHTVADNVDLRYEYFPRSSEQVMVGLFYKHLQNPIEYGLINEGQDTYYKPMNFGNATNMGAEIDITKYFNWFGVKANYTYTHSSITTEKREMQGNDVITRRQTRPLFGQAAHVFNLSLLAKPARSGWEAQLAYCFTGKRLCDISNWYNDDVWERGYHQLDASLEKTFSRSRLTVFAKASNLLDTPVIRYVHQSAHTENVDSERVNGNVVERRECHGQSLTLGLRWKL